jgi:beta-glucanase (GH16 family)
MPLPAGFRNQGEFHTYAFEWLPDKITWFVDGVPIRVKTPGGKRPIPQHSAKILMNLWIFSIANGFGGADPGRNVYPMTAEYEWFRFYKWDREDRYPCANPPACLPAEDKRKSKNNPADGLSP